MPIALLIFFQFLAGFLATLLFHQPLMWMFQRAGMSPRPAYEMTRVPPLGVPSVISLSFWGGLWAVLMLHVLSHLHDQGVMYWIAATVFGAVLPTLVAGLVVVPLKKIKVSNRGQMLIVGLVVNGAWGLGSALIYRLLAQLA
jgi:hypothetical protein